MWCIRGGDDVTWLRHSVGPESERSLEILRYLYDSHCLVCCSLTFLSSTFVTSFARRVRVPRRPTTATTHDGNKRSSLHFGAARATVYYQLSRYRPRYNGSAGCAGSCDDLAVSAARTVRRAGVKYCEVSKYRVRRARRECPAAGRARDARRPAASAVARGSTRGDRAAPAAHHRRSA